MSHEADGETAAASITHPTFAHGEDLYVLTYSDGCTEFLTGLHGQSLKSDTVIDVRDQV